MTNEQKIKLLKSYLTKLQGWYKDTFELCPADLDDITELPVTSPQEEEIARIADDYGFDGSLYRQELLDPEPLSDESIERLKLKIKTVPKIIAAIEKPVVIDKSLIPVGAELINISQLARKLQMGESVVREKNNKGLIPAPVLMSGNLMWVRKEIDDWLSVGCPQRQEWEQLKQQKQGV